MERQAQGAGVEDDFFRQEDAKLLDKLRALKDATTTRELLARATGITDSEVLDKLAALKIGGETAAALSVLPYVEVAWADGELDAKERRLLIEHAATKGFSPGTTEYALLESWLEKRPEPRFFAAWTELVHGLCARLSGPQVVELRRCLVERAQSVANASGGVLGLRKTSDSEKRAIARLERAFDRRG